ncbi:MAG: insulinase family protein [Bacteroidales bacterium]|nr:insulinase family protein [Bacteroidales bacterium]
MIHTLANGIRVVFTPIKGDVGYCGIIVGAGSRNEKPEEYGIAHFIEHTIFKGTKKRSAYAILNRLDSVGGELNAYTTKEETTVHAAFLLRDFERAAELLADMLFNSTFPQRELNREKDVIADEILSYADTPSEAIFDDFEEMVFSGSSLAHNILGTTELLATFDGEAAQRFMHRNYTTDRIVFSVMGDFHEAEVLRVAEKYLGSQAKKLAVEQGKSVAVYTPSNKVIERDTHQCHVVIGSRAPSCFDEDKLATSMVASYLGGDTMNARLSMLLRERAGIGYNVSAEYTSFADIGLFTIYFGTDSSSLNRALRIVKKEIERLRSVPFTEVQLARFKRQFIGQLLMSSVDNEENMLSAGRSVLLYGRVVPTDEICRRIEAVGPADLLRAAQALFDPERISQLIYK